MGTNFLITGLKRVRNKSFINLLRREVEKSSSCADKINSAIDFKSLFKTLPKVQSSARELPLISMFKNPEIQFYSDDFVNKFLEMLNEKGLSVRKTNLNKIPRFLYHLTTKSNYSKMLETGIMKPAKEGLCGENIFMLDITNFFKHWTKFNAIGGNHQKRLLKKVSGANKEDIVLLKIPTNQLKKEKLGIRSQDVIYSNAEYLGGEQVEFIKKFNCQTEEELLQLLEKDNDAFSQFANIFKRYLHLTKGTNAGNQRLFTTRKDAIEYIYPYVIDMTNVKKIGQINPSEFELCAEFNPNRPMQSVLGKLLEGQPEQKGALLIQG